MSFWYVKCDCGAEKWVLARSLITGNTKSCGCGVRQKAKITTHGMSKTRVYKQWGGMLTRCRGNHPRYGQRGITVCDRWLKFENFYADMGNPPGGQTLERIDNNKGYGPDNCRWATRAEQAINQERITRITVNGVTKRVAEWAADLGVADQCIHGRIRKGWDPVEAVTTPRYEGPRRQNGQAKIHVEAPPPDLLTVRDHGGQVTRFAGGERCQMGTLSARTAARAAE